MDFLFVQTSASLILMAMVVAVAAVDQLPKMDVVLRGTSTSLIRVLDEVTVSASIRHPPARPHVVYEFSWDFGDRSGSQWTTILESSGSSSVAAHKYGVAGDYIVRVNATIGPATSSDVISGRLLQPLIVVEQIRDVHLRPLLDVYEAVAFAPVTFEAWTYHGSHVHFAFDFGDALSGSAKKVRGLFDVMRSMPFAHAVHVYDKVGSYAVSVVASNPLGNRSCVMGERFVVLTPSSDLRLDLRTHYVTSPTNVTRFRATLLQNRTGSDVTNLTYDWNFGNGVTFNSTEPEVDYAYPVSGTFELSVAVRSATSTTKMSASRVVLAKSRVFVLKPLEGVRVEAVPATTSGWQRNKNDSSCSATAATPDAIFATHQVAEFVAILDPTFDTRAVYYWHWTSGDFNGGDRKGFHSARRTIVGRLKAVFVKEGRYSLWVRANNWLSETVSTPLRFSVLRPIDGLRRIQHPGSVVLGTVATFRARFWHGSCVTQRWHFGDGSEPFSTSDRSRSDQVHHLYLRTGEFRVSVRLSNALSEAEMTSVIFVVNERCDKPEVSILGANDNLKIRQSGMLRLSAVDVDDDSKTSMICKASTAVNHTWKIDGPRRRSGTSRGSLQTAASGRMLVLPLTGFDVGNYTASLKVDLVGTVVFATAFAAFQILPDDGFVRILGGSARLIGRSETVVLVANTSLPKNQSTTFIWSCSPLERPESDCFVNANENSMSTNSYRNSFPASDLDHRLSSFLFTLTARRAIGGPLIKADQLIEISSASKTLHLVVTCQSCTDDDLAFKQDPILLAVQCPNCTSDVFYEWQIWLVQDGNQNLPISYHDCVSPDGTTFFLNASSTASPLDVDNDAISVLNQRSSAVHDGEDRLTTMDFDDVTSDWPVEWGESTPSANPIGGSFDEDLDPSQLEMLEGYTGYPGRVPSRNILMGGRIAHPNHEGVGRSVPTKLLGTDVDKIVGSRHRRSSFGAEWKYVRLDEGRDVLYGSSRRRQKLFVRRNVLGIGRTYVFVATARADSGGAFIQGKASQQVTVSLGPTNGRCNLKPLNGREYETQFKLDCYEWKAATLSSISSPAFFYELSYSLSDDHDQNSKVLVYYGLDNNFKFVLPAGRRHLDYELKLNVVVWQDSGSNTVVCSITRMVQPLGQLSNSSVSRVLSRELNYSSQSNISVNMHWSNFGSALNRIQVLASVLNGDPFITDSREQIRHRTRLLKFIFKVELTNSAEALQLIQAVREIYRKPKMLDSSQLSSSLKALRRAAKFFWSSNSICAPFCSQGLRALFDATDAILQMLPDSTKLLESALTVLHKTIAARLPGDPFDVDGFTSSSLSSSLRGKSSLTLDAVCVDHADDVSNLVVDLKIVRVTLERSLPPFQPCHCVQALTSRLVYGDLTSANNVSRSVYSTMVSLRISSSCDANGWYKESDRMDVIVDIPRAIGTLNATKSSTMTSFATRQQMNVHEFSMPAMVVNNSLLFMTLRFDQTLDMSAVLILLSDQYPPSLQNSIYRHHVSVCPETFNLSLLGHQLKGQTAKYYLAVLDAASMQTTQSRFAIDKVDYLLDVQVVECLQWNSRSGSSSSWTASGCRLEAVSALVDGVRCRCGKLGSFTSAWHSLNTFQTVSSLDHLIGSQSNLLLPVILLLFLIVYVVLCCNELLWKLHKDIKKHHCGAQYLADNSPKDRHLYEVTLQTGHRPQSGTSAKVYIVLHGGRGLTEPRELTIGDDHLQSGIFQLGSLDTFLLTSPSNLGSIFKIQLWHDNSGFDPSWFLDHVVVTDVALGKQHYFECRMWFAVERDDGKIEREIHVTEGERNFSSRLLSVFWTFSAYSGWPLIFERHDSGHYRHQDRTLGSVVCVLISTVLSSIWCLRNSTQFSGLFEIPQPSLELLKISSSIASVGFLARLLFAIIFHHSKLPSCGRAIDVSEENKSTRRESTSGTEKSVHDRAKNAQVHFDVDEPIDNFSVLQDWAEQQWRKNIVQVYSKLSLTSISLNSVFSTVSTSSNSELQINDSTGFSLILPVRIRYFVWVFGVCIAAIILGISSIIVIRFSCDLSYVWLQIILLSIAVDVSVFGPIVNSTGALIFFAASLISKDPRVFSSCVRSCRCQCGNQTLLEQQAKRTSSSGAMGDSFSRKCLARQRSREVRFARPPTERQLLKYRACALKTLKMNVYLKEILASFFVFVVLAGVIFSQNNSDIYRLNNLLDQSIARTVPFYEASSTSAFLHWVETEFVDFILPANNEIKRTLYFGGTTSVILGPVKLSRQTLGNIVDMDPTKDQINLPNNSKQFTQVLRELTEDAWVRNHTDQMTLEFVLYNIPTKLFSSVRLNMHAFNASTSIEIRSVLLSAETWPLNVISSLSKVFLFFWVVWSSSSVLIDALQRPRRDSLVIRRVIQYVSLFTLWAYFIALNCLEGVSKRIFDHFDDVKSPPTTIDISMTFILKQCCSGLLGTAMILHLTTSARLLRICPNFVRPARFLRTYCVPLTMTSCATCVVFISFACLGSAWFSPQGILPAFRTPFTALQFLLKITTGTGRFNSADGMPIVYTVAFLAVLFLTLTKQTKCTVNTTTCVEPPVRAEISFTLKDLFEHVRKRLSSSFSRRHESQVPVDSSPRISVEFILAELESQVEAMYSLANRLAKDVDGCTDDTSSKSSSSDVDDDVDPVILKRPALYNTPSDVFLPEAKASPEDFNENVDTSTDYLLKLLHHHHSSSGKFSSTRQVRPAADDDSGLDASVERAAQTSGLSKADVVLHSDRLCLFPEVNICNQQPGSTPHKPTATMARRRRIRRTKTRGKGRADGGITIESV